MHQIFSIGRPFRIALLVYILAAQVITWPAATQLSTHAIGAGYGDQFENIRLIWWQAYALQHGLNPFYQSLLGYPNGFFSATQVAEPLTYWIATPLALLIGPVAAYNLVILIGLVLTGLSAFYLCRTLVPQDDLARDLAALFGGLVFIAYPALQGHLSAGHVNVLALYALPIYALCLTRILAGLAGPRTVIGGALAFVLTALGSVGQIVYTLFPVSFFFVLYALLFDRRSLFRRVVIRNLARLWFAAGLLLVPFYWPLLAQLSAPQPPADLQESGWVTYSADPLAFVSPSPFTGWGTRLAPGYTRAVLGTNNAEGSAYLGLIAGLLALVTAVRGLRNNDRFKPWLFLLVGAMIFSLGPILKWLDQPVVYTLGDQVKSNIVLPWALFQSLPFFSASRTPGRFNLTTGLALAVLAAAGLSAILKRFNGRRTVQITLTGILMIGTLAEYQLFSPALTTSAAIPPIFYEIAQRTDIRAVLDVPWDNLIAAKEALLFQTAHHKPLIAGQVTRRTPVDPAKLNVLEAAATNRIADSLTEASDYEYADDTLNEYGVDLTIFHKDFLPPINQARLPTGLVLYEDDRLLIIETPKLGNPNRAYVLEAEKARVFYLYASQEEAVRLDFRCRLAQGNDCKENAHAIEIDGKPTSASNVPSGLSYIWTRLTHGFHTVRLTAPDYVTVELGEQRTLKQPLQLEGGMSLVGSIIDCCLIDSLTVHLMWHAAQKLPNDYHLFVHLLDKDSKIAAQYDNQPGGGAYPTTQWAADQDWAESISLPIKGLAAGDYELYTGWYRYPDLTRLGVLADTPSAKDGLVYLGRVSIGKP